MDKINDKESPSEATDFEDASLLCVLCLSPRSYNDPDKVRTHLLHSAKHAKATLVTDFCQRFNRLGISGLIVLA